MTWRHVASVGAFDIERQTWIIPVPASPSNIEIHRKRWRVRNGDAVLAQFKGRDDADRFVSARSGRNPDA